MAQGSISTSHLQANEPATIRKFVGPGAGPNHISSTVSYSFGLGMSSTAARKCSVHRGLCITALQRKASEGFDEPTKIGKAGGLPVLENGSWVQGKNGFVVEQNEALWEKIDIGLRIAYASGVYGAMALAGQAICYFSGSDNTGGFGLCLDVAMEGVGYAIPPVIALLFILDDEVVKKSPPARAIRESEDDELFSFFVGMSLWQLVLVVATATAAEEMFFRIGVQGGLVHFFMSDEKIPMASDGLAALTGIFPYFAPFSHALAAVLTAALTGSLMFATSFPQDPKYVIAPVHSNHAARRELKKTFATWYERRQLRKIYPSLLDFFLALYLGFEWTKTGNVLAPMITHMIYSAIIVGNGLRRVHDRREKIRERTQRFWAKDQSDIKQ